MQTLQTILWNSVCLVVAVYAVSFLFVGMCLLGTETAVENCRDNMAGGLVYSTLTLFR